MIRRKQLRVFLATLFEIFVENLVFSHVKLKNVGPNLTVTVSSFTVVNWILENSNVLSKIFTIIGYNNELLMN